MSIFENQGYHTFIVIGNEKPVERQAYDGLRLFPYQEIVVRTCPITLENIAKVGDMFFATATNNANVIVKTSNMKNLVFSTYVPKVGDTIPVKYIKAVMGKPQFSEGSIEIVKMIKLSTNCYVINPKTINEVVLITSEP